MSNVPRPTKGQLAWQALEFGLFFHFGINTFYGKEWSDGTLDAAGFNPTQIDAAGWVATAKAAGARYVILTAKHHDGFCLWPTATTEYSVKASPHGGDVVGELAAACAAAGMPLGLYLSPWDRNAACYDDPEAYDRFYCAQMTELCSNYGPLCEIWLDGAGSEGRVYNWDAIMEVTGRLQPDAMIFNMGRATIRWAGNEDGLAQDPNYLAVSSLAVSAFTQSAEKLQDGRDAYLPPECDVPIRQNWFWQPDDLGTLKTPENLLGIFYRSIGRGANLLLNVPPNRDGALDERDVECLLAATTERKQRLARPYEARVKPDDDGGFMADFGDEIIFDHLIVREDITDGQRIDGYRIADASSGQELASGQTIGYQKWEVFPATTTRRIHIELGPDCAEDAKILSVIAYHTGHEALPSVAQPMDYEAWAERADKK